MKLLALVILIISLPANADITEGGRGMLFGTDHAFAVTAKSGWVLDNQSGVNQGLHMVFYPKGETWSKSPVIIYGRAIPTTDASTIKSHIDNTVKDFRSNGSPNYTSEKLAPLTLANGNKAEIYLFSGDQWNNYEAGVYFQEQDTINYLIFNARKKEDFDKYFGDFQQIASSYQNLYKPAAAITAEELSKLKKESDLILKEPGGKEYESKAIHSIGQTMANIMRDCTSYMPNEELPAFNYFVRIGKDGSIIDSSIYPTNALSACFSGLMSGANYPPHSFKSFLLNIDMKFKP